MRGLQVRTWLTAPRRVVLVFLLCVVLAVPGGPAFALGPGDAAPGFELPRLEGEGVVRAPAVFAAAPLTALIFWNRGCPECLEIAMGMQVLTDSLRPLGGEVTGVAFGPDDAVSIRDLVHENRIAATQLWDAGGTVAAQYGLGRQHLSVFLVDRDGVVREAFDDRIPSLMDPVWPAARRILGAAAPSPLAEIVTAPSPAPGPVPEAVAATLSSLRLDARMKVLSTEGAEPGDRGLYNEPLENGSLFLFRFDLRLPLALAPGVELVPWLRVSNEDDEILTEQAEQLSSPRGTLSLNLRAGRWAGTVGAFPLRVAPLLLQRWDATDAPPLGGVAACACGGGAEGISQRSLEVLGPEYTFEGVSASYTERLGGLRAWFAIPRWERVRSATAPILERLEGRYRRLLGGAYMEMGSPGTRDAESSLPAPLGLRVGVVSVTDDGRTLGAGSYRPLQHDELGWVAQARAEPVPGLSADAQWATWRLDESGTESNGDAYLAGARGSFRVEPVEFWARLHRLHTDPGFAPLYRALTYEPNQEGWRAEAGFGGWRATGSRRDRFAASAFYRETQETEERDAPGLGKTEYRVVSLSLSVRPAGDLVTELSAVETRTEKPSLPLERSRGLSLDGRWEGSGVLDPSLHVDMIRRQALDEEERTIWQVYLWVRVVR
jgi:peroxiredoxin